MNLDNKKQHYRAVKYVWNPEWIGKEHFDVELKAAKGACIADIVVDWCQDHDVMPTDAQQKLTAMHIMKYGSFKVFLHNDRCYTKVLLEIDL